MLKYKSIIADKCGWSATNKKCTLLKGHTGLPCLRIYSDVKPTKNVYRCVYAFPAVATVKVDLCSVYINVLLWRGKRIQSTYPCMRV